MAATRKAGGQLAAEVNVLPGTVSRWRNPKYKAGPPAEHHQAGLERALGLPAGAFELEPHEWEVALKLLKSPQGYSPVPPPQDRVREAAPAYHRLPGTAVDEGSRLVGEAVGQAFQRAIDLNELWFGKGLIDLIESLYETVKHLEQRGVDAKALQDGIRELWTMYRRMEDKRNAKAVGEKPAKKGGGP